MNDLCKFCMTVIDAASPANCQTQEEANACPWHDIIVGSRFEARAPSPGEAEAVGDWNPAKSAAAGDQTGAPRQIEENGMVGGNGIEPLTS